MVFPLFDYKIWGTVLSIALLLNVIAALTVVGVSANIAGLPITTALLVGYCITYILKRGLIVG